LVELKAILAIVLCLVIIGGAVYLHIKRKKK
jgi:LPXTG-motif cell wall-anchored protein